MMDESDNVDFEDDRAYLNKEAQTRRRYMRLFNKRRDDFTSDGEYDDYLEMVEGTIFNLVNDIDVEETKQNVERYRRENQELISQNHAKNDEEDRMEAARVATAERARIARLQELRKIDEDREREVAKKRIDAQVEELVRVSRGDDALARLKKKKEKTERKKRRKEAAAQKAAEIKAQPDLAPMWFRPNFPSPLPTPLPPATPLAEKDPSRAAAAAGFRQKLVYDRAVAEFRESLLGFAISDKNGS